DSTSTPPFETIALKVRPPPETSSRPPLDTVVPVAVPPDSSVSCAAMLPELTGLLPDSTVDHVEPPADPVSLPPLGTVAPPATPAEDTTSRPPLETIVPLAAPLAKTTCRPPLRIVVPLAVPPDETNTPPCPLPKRLFDAVALLATPPLEMTSLPVPNTLVFEAMPPFRLSTALVVLVKPVALTTVPV